MKHFYLHCHFVKLSVDDEASFSCINNKMFNLNKTHSFREIHMRDLTETSKNQ